MLRLLVTRLCLFLFAIFGLLSSVMAQPWAGFGIEGRVMEGRMIRHAKSFTGPLPDRVGTLEINFLNQTYGRRAWQAHRGYPVVGVAAAYVDYGIDSIYGKAIAVFPNLQFPLLSSKRAEWTVRLGWGPGYITRRYDRADQPAPDTVNVAIGSHLNGFVNVVTDLRYRIDDHWAAGLGLYFHHHSNAAIRRPNLGLNVYGLHASVRYSPVTSRPLRLPATTPRPRNRWWGAVRAGLTFQEEGPADGPLFPVYLGSVYGGRRLGGRNKVFVGLDASYHTRIEAFLKNNEILSGKEEGASWKGAVFGGHEAMFGRVGLLTQVGVYVREAYLRLDPFYQKLGVQYAVLQREDGVVKDAFASILLKTHLSQAELFEFGIGVGF